MKDFKCTDEILIFACLKSICKLCKLNVPKIKQLKECMKKLLHNAKNTFDWTLKNVEINAVFKW